MVRSKAQINKMKDMDPGIKEFVIILNEWGIETFESCEGGEGHPFPEPAVRFYGGRFEGINAFRIAVLNGFSVSAIWRYWSVIEEELTGPFWEITLNNLERKNAEYRPLVKHQITPKE